MIRFHFKFFQIRSKSILVIKIIFNINYYYKIILIYYLFFTIKIINNAFLYRIVIYYFVNSFILVLNLFNYIMYKMDTILSVK